VPGDYNTSHETEARAFMRSILRITVSCGGGNALIGALLVAVLCALATDAVAFESDIWAGTLPSRSTTVSVQSWKEVEGLPYTVEDSDTDD